MSVELTWQLVDPWTNSGWPLLGGVAALLTLLTLWTYWGQRNVGRGRVLTVLGLRLLALLIACVLLTRPGLAVRDTTPVPSKFLVLVDGSQSMSIRDGGDGKTRWEAVRRVWRSDDVQRAQAVLQNEQQVELVYYQGADDVSKLNLDATPTGKRTRIGTWLQRLRELHVKDSHLRGLLLFSDGIDNDVNGGRVKAEEAARSYRDLNCPIYTYQMGKTNTTRDDCDIALVAVKATPSTAAIKAPLTVTAQVIVHGIESPTVSMELLAEDKGQTKVLAKKQVQLTRAAPQQNEVRFEPIHPDRVGELKLTVRAVPLPQEANVFNNEMSTYVNVSKEGVSVLWVEARPRAWEPVFAIRHALARDPRFRISYTEPPPDGFDSKLDFYQFLSRAESGQQYDVIVIGDISARQFTGSSPEKVNQKTIDQVSELVSKKSVGLLLLGGRQTFWNSDWQDAPYNKLTNLLPVERPGERLPRLNGPMKAKLPQQGETYLTKLTDKGGVDFWGPASPFEPFDGVAALGKPKGGSTVYLQAQGEQGEPVPLLVGGVVAGTRVVMFGGDTTWKAWRHSPEAVAAYERFWRQLLLWLAKQEETEGSLWIRPDTRRELAGHQKRVAFHAGMRGKGGQELPGARLWAQVYGPDKKKLGPKVQLQPDKDGARGFTPTLEEPGEYEIEVIGEAKDKGTEVKDTKKARFMAYAEDIEMATWAADDKLLEQLARLSGGQVVEGEDQLLSLLKTLGERRATGDRTRVERWPDWSRKPWSDAAPDQFQALWGSGTLECVLMFTLLICTEWVLRRRWGLV